MTTKKAIEIASRIYGLYLLIQLPIALSGLFSVFAINNDQWVKNPMLYQIWAVLHPILYLIIALILILKAESIANLVAGKKQGKEITEEGNKPSHSQLSFWIILLGIYFLISSASKLIGDLVRHPLHWGDAYSWSILLSHGCILISSFVLILKSEWIESIIIKRLER